MSTFTTTLKRAINDLYNESSDPDEFIQEYVSVTFAGETYGKLPTLPDWEKIGLAFYPIFDEGYRPVINGLIIDHFYNREIGTETIDNWVLMIRRKMNLRMPYYNKMFESLAIEYGPLDTMKIVSKNVTEIESTENVVASNSTDASAGSESRAVSSSTPQTVLSGDEDYATGATDSNSDSTSTSTSDQDSTSTGNTTNNAETEVSGYQGAASRLMMQYRESIINVNEMIINDLEVLFMGILDTSDSYFNQRWYSSW
jgi:hypothetical protein